jgi:hypothetical protein
VDAPGFISHLFFLPFLKIYYYYFLYLDTFVLFPSFVEFLHVDSFVVCLFVLSKERYYVGRGMYESTTDFIK